MPFIPSPFTNDLPYMAWYDVRTPGLSGNRAFGERDTGMDEGARRAHRRWCEFGIRLSLGRIHLGLQRDEGEGVWRRRLRASLRLNGIRELIVDLPNLRGDDEQRYTTLIDTFIARARDFEMGPLYEEVTRPGSDPAHLRYIQDRYIRPSLPDLHFTNVNNRFTLWPGEEGRETRVALEEGIDHVLLHLRRLRRRLLNQRAPSALVDAVILGTYTEDILRTVLVAITSRQANAAFGVRAGQATLSASAIAAMLREWIRRPRNALNVGIGGLLSAQQQQGQAEVSALATARGRAFHQCTALEDVQP